MDEDDEELARLLPPTSRHNSPARPHTATTRRESPGRRSSCSRQPSPVRQQRKYPEQKENISSSQHNTRQSYSTVQEFRIDEKLSNLACHTKHKKFAGERIRLNIFFIYPPTNVYIYFSLKFFFYSNINYLPLIFLDRLI